MIMTKALQRKFENAVKEFRTEYPSYYIHGHSFHHYGEDYRIEENGEEYKIFRICKTDIYDTLIETIPKKKKIKPLLKDGEPVSDYKI